MFINDPVFIAIFFRLLNFGVVSALAVYLFKRYGLNILQVTMARKVAHLYDLQQQDRELKSQADEAEKLILEQEALCKKLTYKVDVWQQRFNETAQLRDQGKKRLLSVLVQRKSLQQQFIANDITQRRVLPVVLKGANEQLMITFANDQKGRDFLRQVVSHMERSAR